MTATFSFIKGIGFTLALFTSFLVGFYAGEYYVEREANEDGEEGPMKDVGVEEI